MCITNLYTHSVYVIQTKARLPWNSKWRPSGHRNKILQLHIADIGRNKHRKQKGNKSKSKKKRAMAWCTLTFRLSKEGGATLDFVLYILGLAPKSKLGMRHALHSHIHTHVTHLVLRRSTVVLLWSLKGEQGASVEPLCEAYMCLLLLLLLLLLFLLLPLLLQLWCVSNIASRMVECTARAE